MNNKNKILAIIITVLLMGSIVFSYAYIYENLNHNCSKRDCPICMQMEMAAQNISNIKYIVPVLLFIMVVLCVFTQFYASVIDNNCIKNTLITLKVELLI